MRFGPRVGAEEVWAYNPGQSLIAEPPDETALRGVHTGRMLGTAPLGGWKVPYDGPVDTNLAISVDRRISVIHRPSR